MFPENKVRYGSKHFDLHGLFKCAYCGACVLGEEKFKLLKSGKKNRHVYYHCSKKVDPNCPEPYMNEHDLIEKLIQFVELIEKRKKDLITTGMEIETRMIKYKVFKDQVLYSQNIDLLNEPLMFSEYFKHAVRNGMKKKSRSF